MTLDPTGAWGLRHRLQVALSLGYSYEGLSIIVNVDAATLQAYMTNPSYQLDPLDVALIIDNLFDIDTPDVFYDRVTTPHGVTITYVESPWWDEEQLEMVMRPDLATAFKVHYMSESDQHRPMSTPLFHIPPENWVDVAMSATGGDLERLICIVFYEYQDVVA